MQQNQKIKQLGGYQVICQLGKGSFGTVYKAKNIKKQEQDDTKLYAIKVQNIGTVKPMLHLQAEILKNLRKKQFQQQSPHKGYSIPQVLTYHEEEYFSYMVMDLLDTTLQDFANKEMKNKFSKDCLIRIFYSILQFVQNLHQLGYTHRDIKPANFMLKLNREVNETTTVNMKCTCSMLCDQTYRLFFPLIQDYVKVISIHQPGNISSVRTPIFCSLNTHQGLEQSRRDDLQSIAYLVTYLVKKLPWQLSSNSQPQKKPYQLNHEIQSPRKIKSKLDIYEKIYQIKNSTNFDHFLTDAQLLPSSFLEIYKYIIELSFEQEPNYKYVYNLLEKQHYQLTGINLSQMNYECKWGNLCYKENNQIQQSTDNKKKIKINFKIPPKKLKKPQFQSLNEKQTLPETS